MRPLVNGAHVIIESEDPEADRALFRDVLGFDFVDAGGGWLIFALPAAEVAVHPGSSAHHQLYLMCDDLDATLRELGAKGVRIKPDIHGERWGRLATIVLPGGGEVGVYQPSHPRPGRG
jgi:catechol 2,3-dioxygenase-like lactoylglutathione lyase family enzyme